MSKSGSPVHAANTCAWKPLDFLSLPGERTQGFIGLEFHNQVEPGFAHTRIASMQDKDMHTPVCWSPGAGSPPAPTAVTQALPTLTDAAHDQEQDLQALERIRDQAFEEGLAQGRLQAQAASQAQGQAHADLAAQQGTQAIQDLLTQIHQTLAGLHAQADTLHAPLKRLALHIAEELVLGELSLNASAIDRLVQRCIDVVDAQNAKQLVVELHPDDLDMLQQHPDTEADRPSAWTWQANANLLPGSVRVRVDEAVVSDLIEHRLHTLAKQLLGPQVAWSEHSAFDPTRLAQRHRSPAPIEEAVPRMGSTQESAFDEPLSKRSFTSHSDDATAHDAPAIQALDTRSQASALPLDPAPPLALREDLGHA